MLSPNRNIQQAYIKTNHFHIYRKYLASKFRKETLEDKKGRERQMVDNKQLIVHKFKLLS